MSERSENKGKRVIVAVSFDPVEWEELNGVRHDLRIDSKGEFIRRMVEQGIKDLKCS